MLRAAEADLRTAVRIAQTHQGLLNLSYEPDSRVYKLRRFDGIRCMQVQQQLSLLGDSGRTIQVPTAIHKALSVGFALAISVSGGKDSDAMARAIVRWF